MNSRSNQLQHVFILRHVHHAQTTVIRELVICYLQVLVFCFQFVVIAVEYRSLAHLPTDAMRSSAS